MEDNTEPPKLAQTWQNNFANINKFICAMPAANHQELLDVLNKDECSQGVTTSLFQTPIILMPWVVSHTTTRPSLLHSFH